MWATKAADGTIHVVVINQDTVNEHDVAVTVPGQTTPGTIESLTAPSISATTGVSLGGQTFGAETSTGTLPGPAVTTAGDARRGRLHDPRPGGQRRDADDPAGDRPGTADDHHHSGGPLAC